MTEETGKKYADEVKEVVKKTGGVSAFIAESIVGMYAYIFILHECVYVYSCLCMSMFTYFYVLYAYLYAFL